MQYKQILVTFLFALTVIFGYGQDEPEPAPAPTPPEVDIYTTTGGELIFSFADLDYDGVSVSNILRFTGFLHLNELVHFDFTNSFGMYTGGSLRNVGFISDDDPIRINAHEGMIAEGDDVRIKRRAYSLGVPLAIKIGNFKRGAFFYGGAEAEFMFHYKEKLFINGDKEDKYNEWFSDRVNLINPSVFGGFQFPGGLNVKFKYYLLDFLDDEYTERNSAGDLVRPYQGLQSQMFYISLSFNLQNKKATSFDFDRT